MAVPIELSNLGLNLLLGLISEFKGSCPPILQYNPSDTPSAHFRASLPSFPAWIQAPTEQTDVFTHRIITDELQIPIPDLQLCFCPFLLAGKLPSFSQTLHEVCSQHSPVNLSLPKPCLFGVNRHVCQSRSSSQECKTLALVALPELPHISFQ